MTYSIMARDRGTGEPGVAVQSHYFSVGPVVPWVEAGVGAVATQAMVEISYGPRGLELMRAGATAADALRLNNALARYPRVHFAQPKGVNRGRGNSERPLDDRLQPLCACSPTGMRRVRPHGHVDDVHISVPSFSLPAHAKSTVLARGPMLA